RTGLDRWRPGYGRPATPRRTSGQWPATRSPSPPGPSAPTSSDAATRLAAPFFGYPVQAGRDRRQPLVQLQPGGIQGRPAIVGQGTPHRITVAARREGLRIGAALQRPLDRPHPPDTLFQLLLGVAIRLVGGPGGLTQVVKLAQLVR